MPWGRRQATAVLIKAQKSGNRKLAKKAKGYLKDKPAVVKAQRKRRK